MCCTPEAMLSMWKPGWKGTQAGELFDWARLHVSEGDVVWDLGANQGLFSVAAAERSGVDGTVIAFEPDLKMQIVLNRTLQRNRLMDRVKVLPLAVGGRDGVSEFAIAATDRALNHLVSSEGNPRTGGVRKSVMVPTFTMDRLLDDLPKPDLVKIDIEGAELDAFRGADRMLGETRPLFILECVPEHVNEMEEILGRHDYAFCDPLEAMGGEWAHLGWNTLLIPRENYCPLVGGNK